VRGVCFGDALEQGALLNAVAAPDTADDQDVHLANEAAGEFALAIGEMRGIIDLLPAALLLFGAGLNVTGIGLGGGEFVSKIGGVHWTYSERKRY